MKSLHIQLQRLVDSGLEFVVVGGFAGVLHGSAYVTEDLDICAVMSPENIEMLRIALADLKPVHRMTPNKLSFFEHPSRGENSSNVYPETEAGLVDVLANIPGIGTYQDLARNAIEVQLFGRRCRVISLADLITAKEAMGRERDLLTAKELRAIAAKRQGY